MVITEKLNERGIRAKKHHMTITLFLKKGKIGILTGFFLVLCIGIMGLPAISRAERDEAAIDQAFALAAATMKTGRYETALAECRSFIRQYPRHEKTVKITYMYAEALFQQKKYAEASEALRSFILENNRPAYSNLVISARLRLGECAFNLKKYLKAIEHFEWVASQQNNALRAEALGGIAYAHLVRREFDKAESYFLRLLQSYPGYQNLPKIIVPLGLIYMVDDQLAKAIDLFSRAPQDVACLYYRGVCHLKLNRVITSTQLLKEVLDVDTEKKWSDKAMYQMGESYFQSKEFPLAYNAYKKVYTTMLASTLRADALFRMGCVNFQIGKFEQAAFNWNQLVKEYPDTLSGPASQYLLAELSLRQNELGNAIGHFSHLQNVSEYSMDAQYKIIWSYAVQGQYDAVISKANQFLKEFEWGDLHAKVLLLKGLSQQLMQKEDEAVQTYQRLLDRFPDTIYYEKGLYLMTITYYQMKRFAEIVTHVNQLLKMTPTSPSRWQAETYFWVGEAYYNIGNFELARQMYEMVYNNYRTSDLIPHVLLGIAACYARTNQYDKSIEMQAKAMEVSQELENPEVKKSAMLDTADVLFNKREYEKAISYYDEFVRKNPKDSRTEKALFQQGIALYRLEFFTEAIKKWDYLANHYRESKYASDAIFQTGRTYFGLSRYDDALRSFQKILDMYPQSGLAREALLQLGQCYFNAGNINQAIVQYRAYLEKYPRDEKGAEVTELLQMCYYKQGKTAKELKELTSQFPQSKFSADIFWELGAECYNRKEYDRSLEYFERIILDFPNTSQAKQAFFYKADAYFMKGDYKPAVTNFSNYIINYPEEALVSQARFKLGVSYFNMKDYLQAAVAFNNFIESHPNDPKARDATLNIPLCYRKAAQFYQAIETYKNFMQRYSQDEQISFVKLQIGQLYEEVNDYQRAIESYNTIEGDKKEIFEALFSVGRCYRKLTAPAEEQKAYERLMRFTPKNNQFRLAGLVLLGEMYEQSGFIQKAIEVYQDIASYSANQEWRNIANEKIKMLKGK